MCLLAVSRLCVHCLYRALTGGGAASDVGTGCRLACAHVLRLLAPLQPAGVGEIAQELMDETLQACE